MIKDIEKLAKLQIIDTEIMEIEEQLEDLPVRLNEFESLLEKSSSCLKVEKKELSKLRVSRRECEGRLKVVEEAMAKLQGRLSEVKTNKEYNSFLSEIENYKNKASICEEDIIVLMEKEDELEAKEKELLLEIEQEKEKVTQLQEKEKKESRILHKQLKERVQARNIEADDINSELYALYEKIRARKNDGVAICGLVGEPGHESCGGCFVYVPMFLVEKAKRKADIVQCENCSRILY